MVRNTRKRQQSKSCDALDDADVSEGRLPDHVTAMFETLQRTQMEAFEKLINKVSDSVPRMTSSPTFVSAVEAPAGDFSRCKQSYSGAPTESLEGFIDAVESYKECAHVSNSSALRGLSMLFTHDAATWWQGVKPQIASWNEAIENLRSAFGDRRPPPKIYRLLFSTEQGEHEKTDIFVSKARALLARIPTGDLSEKVQLDMVYSLLHNRIRKRLRREEVVNFSDLLHRAREIEDSGDAPRSAGAAPTSRARAAGPTFASPAARPAPASQPPPPRASSSRAAPSAPAPPAPPVFPMEPRQESASSVRPNRQYCVYCRRPGHSREDCSKIKVKSDTNPVVSCYGCGAPGVIRSQCTICNPVSFNAITELSQGLGRTGVLIACYLVYSLRVRANDAIRLVRRKRPRSVQTSGQILCVQQFEHYLLPQTVVFSSKEILMLTKDNKTAEFTIRQYLYRQRATLHGLEERNFKELPKIVYCLCERLLKLSGCQQSVGLDFRVRNRPFYKSFLSYRLRQERAPDPQSPDLDVACDQVPALPMVEWRDPVEEDIERNLETVSRITGGSGGTISALQVYEAFVVDHHSLPDERQKYIKQLRVDINQRREAIDKIDEEEDPAVLTGLLCEWLEGLKQPVLGREDLAVIVARGQDAEACLLALQKEDTILLEYLLRFVTRLRPLAATKKVEIIKRLTASLTHQTLPLNGKCLPTKRDFPRLRDGTASQLVNFMLRVIVEVQKDMAKPGRDDCDVVVPSRRRIKAWK